MLAQVLHHQRINNHAVRIADRIHNAGDIVLGANKRVARKRIVHLRELRKYRLGYDIRRFPVGVGQQMYVNFLMILLQSTRDQRYPVSAHWCGQVKQAGCF